MKGLILAAGLGTRLRPITNRVPKPLLPIANKPTIHYAIQMLRGTGLGEIVVVVGHHAEVIRDALGDGSALGVRLSYAAQDEPRGLAHAVCCARDALGGEPFALVLGDTLYDLDLTPLIERFRETRPACETLVAPVEDPSRYGVAVLEGERVANLEEKPERPRSNLAMTGIYCFGPEVWEVMPRLRPSARGELEITDAIQLLIDSGREVLGRRFGGWWRDTGTLEDMLEANRYWLRGRESLVGPGAQVSNCRLTGGTAVGELAEVSGGEVERSIVLPGVRLRLNGGRVLSCLVGSDLTLAPSSLLEGRIIG